MDNLVRVVDIKSQIGFKRRGSNSINNNQENQIEITKNNKKRIKTNGGSTEIIQQKFQNGRWIFCLNSLLCVLFIGINS